MEKTESLTNWYEKKQQTYLSLAKKVEEVLRENIEQHSIQYHSIESRAKGIVSFSNKAKSGKYKNPKEEIKDLSGIRIITYLENDVYLVSNIVEKLFVIDEENSIDQSKLLGSDKLGYRSVHYVAKFDRKRCALPEYKMFTNLPFEIQIRSLLQHAWAEIEHDRNYKFPGKLPIELERRFYLVAGMLEVADKEFISIADEVERYRQSVTKELQKGDLDIEINTTSLKEYLSNKFRNLIDSDLVSQDFGTSNDFSKLIVEELHLFGISRLSQLDTIIPTDYGEELKRLHIETNFAGIIRDILLIKDADKYFELSWRNSWGIQEEEDVRILKHYKVDTASFPDEITFGGNVH